MHKPFAFAALAVAITGSPAQAGADPRIREMSYDAAAVVTLPVNAGITTLVQFGSGEHVESVGAGQGAACDRPADPWCVTWPANAGFLYVRPRPRASAALSLAVVTDRHAYSLVFEPRSAGLTVHRLVFTYPPVEPVAAVIPAVAVPLVSNKELVAGRFQVAPVPLNANYSIAFGEASEDLRPALAFDDGRFTYLKWPGNREIPAVFEIRADGTQMLANARMQGELMVVDRIARGLMLRSGSAVASIRNEAFDAQGIAPVAGTSVLGVERQARE